MSDFLFKLKCNIKVVFKLLLLFFCSILVLSVNYVFRFMNKTTKKVFVDRVRKISVYNLLDHKTKK